MSPPRALTLADLDTVRDLSTFIQRAKTLSSSGSVRIRGFGQVATALVRVLDRPSILGLKVLPAQGGEHDFTVAMNAVSDRCARMLVEESVDLIEPPVQVHETWAGISPPRNNWQIVHSLSRASIEQTAADGISRIAQELPDDVGAPLLNALRLQVWNEAIGTSSAPAGMALGAHVLGVLGAGEPNEEFSVAESGRWLRLSGPYGHILHRREADLG